MGMLPAHRRRRRVRVLSCGVVSTASFFVDLGCRKWVKRSQWRGAILKTDKNVAITTPCSKVRFTKGAISSVP